MFSFMHHRHCHHNNLTNFSEKQLNLYGDYDNVQDNLSQRFRPY